MYTLLKGALARLLKVPTEPPPAPAGSYRSVQVFRASPSYLTYKLVPFAFGVVLEVLFLVLPLGALALGAAAGQDVPWPVLLSMGGMVVFLGGATLLSYFTIRLDYDLRYYIVTDRSLRIREGAMLVKEMTLTYANVQNLKVEQGPLQRWFGIADVVIDTAGGGGVAQQHPGGSGHRAVLAGVADAEGLRDLIRGYLRQQPSGGGLGDEEEDDEPPAALGAASAAALGLGPDAVAALREVRDAARALREQVTSRA